MNGITAPDSNSFLDPNRISAVLTSAEFVGMLSSAVKDAVNVVISSGSRVTASILYKSINIVSDVASPPRPSLASVTSANAFVMSNESFSSYPALQSIPSLVVEGSAPYEASEDFLSPAPCEGTGELLSSMNYQ